METVSAPQVKYIVKFCDVKDGGWYTLTQKPVSKDEAEKIYNDQTYHSHIWTDPREDLFFKIVEVSCV